MKKYYPNIFLSWLAVSTGAMFYAGNDLKFNLVIIPLVSFFLVILFFLELERDSFQYVLMAKVLAGTVLGLLFPLFNADLPIMKGLLTGWIIGISTPVWVRIFTIIKNYL